jgi:hypothetical protein
LGLGSSAAPDTRGGTAETGGIGAARDEAAGVARTAADRGSEVAGTVGEQAGRVTSETTRQARNLMYEGRDQLSGQARQGQQRAAEGLHELADQLHQMSERADGHGMTPEVVRQAADKTRGLASWLENRDPSAVLDEVRRFARRRPAAFLVGAVLAGAAVGRLTRGAVAAQQADDDGPDKTRTGDGGPEPGPVPNQPAPPVTPATAAPYPEQQAYPPPATTQPGWVNQ